MLERMLSPNATATMFAPVFIALLALLPPASGENTTDISDSGRDKSLDFQADHQNPVSIQVKYPSLL